MASYSPHLAQMYLGVGGRALAFNCCQLRCSSKLGFKTTWWWCLDVIGGKDTKDLEYSPLQLSIFSREAKRACQRQNFSDHLYQLW